MTSPILKKRKNTFSKCRDSTLKTSVFNNNNKESTFQELPNKLSTSFMRREMLASCTAWSYSRSGVAVDG